MKSIIPLSAATLLSCMTITQTYADSYDASGFTVSPMIGMIDFDREDFTYNDTLIGTLAVGYKFNNPYAVELAYTIADTEIDGAGEDVDIRQIQLDGLYHFRRGQRLTPYTVLGLGQSDISTSSEDDEFINVGVGFKYFTTDAWTIRNDIRAVRNLDADSTDLAFRFGISYIFGAGKNSPKPAQVKVSLDDDNDGVKNIADQCPNTARGLTVDNNGCEINNDSDNDGVANAVDQCPNSDPGARVNSDGCYALEKRQETITLNVEFKSNSDVVRSDEQNEIAALAEFMKKYSQTSVVLNGHTDSQGAAGYNQQLSQRRAQAISQVLTNQFGIAPNRIQAIGIGESSPIASNDNALGRQKNRRVEAVVSAREQ